MRAAPRRYRTRRTVGSIVQQAEAVCTAARVSGVPHVEDGLEVRLMGIDGRADADTEAAVLDALSADEAVRARDIEVEAELDSLDRSGGTRAALERKWW